MPDPRARDATAWLLAWNAGEPGALDQRVPLVYAEPHQPSAVTTTRERLLATPPPGLVRSPEASAPPPGG